MNTPPSYDKMSESHIEQLCEHLCTLHFADAIDEINELTEQECVAVFSALPLNYAIELFDKPELLDRASILEQLPIERATALLDGMSADESTNVLQEMPEEIKERFLTLLQPDTREQISQLNSYPDGTVGSLMTTEFLTIPPQWSVQKALDYIREVEPTRETVYVTYVIEPKTNTFLRAISLRRLVLADPAKNVLDVPSSGEPITISPFATSEEVAQLFRRHDLLSIAVVDSNNHVIGIVTVDDVLDAITDELSEDTVKFGGMEVSDRPYMHIGFIEMLRKRGGWLTLLFLSEMLTSSAMQYFNPILEKAIVLSLFIPLVMSSGGNSGSQATSLIIRALALREITLKDWWRVMLREIPAGIALGSLLGVVGILRISIWQFLGLYNYGPHWVQVAATVGIALIGIVTAGGLAGALLPFVLKKLGFDPANASAPFVATLVDVTGLTIYFSIAMIVMQGNIL